MKVLANDGISEAGAKALQEAGIELLNNRVSVEHLSKFINENQVDVLLVRSATQVNRDLIDDCPSLKIVGRAGIGMDNIDVEYAQEMGLTVFNTPDASTRSVAELVFAHLFTLARNLHESNREMPLEGDSRFNELKRSFANSYELQGKTLGIIGMGKIGTEVAKIGITLGMKVLCYNRTPKAQTVELSFFDGQKLQFNLKTVSLEEVLESSDFISINTAKTDSYLIDNAEFEQMKDGVFIVNAARGGVINEVSLLEHLENGKVAGAALDVFENEPHPELPLLMHPALSLSPHIGGSTIDAQQKIGLELAEKLIKLL
ncbi:D-2-hydroxyacid dehydrogenase [Elizabethkingia sp. JS20170427COW]|uniref:D-2-hydroxyacid dehydrogenase n=1 Tax=Elizabethkingia sp. JS20170427COW TaxID=2583851 RepID=UPI001110BDF7|nr:D-2-hydroxyacid dehydrogenase [Elizabethkingia sp. JS20170427COW]QCX52256.1 3-phosphoglycerate dehydrogenase [Elizabethkingia sp. JS20170427COW]